MGGTCRGGTNPACTCFCRYMFWSLAAGMVHGNFHTTLAEWTGCHRDRMAHLKRVQSGPSQKEFSGTPSHTQASPLGLCTPTDLISSTLKVDPGLATSHSSTTSHPTLARAPNYRPCFCLHPSSVFPQNSCQSDPFKIEVKS